MKILKILRFGDFCFHHLFELCLNTITMFKEEATSVLAGFDVGPLSPGRICIWRTC